jgi:glycolate oxidase iron-sulfur subunit
VTEVLADVGLPPAAVSAEKLAVAYHSACSMQHGQKIDRAPRALLASAGFEVKEIAEGHLCCGSAGTYNVLQPELATRLRDRKLAEIARTRAAVVATGNVGCITQLAAGAAVPVVHTVELLDWATGGPRPPALANFSEPAASKAAMSNGGAM